jgi:hypothetical protein
MEFKIMESKKPISRRYMLKGMGACIALPFLDVMIPSKLFASISNTNLPKRVSYFFMPNGVHPHKWTPEGIGTDFSFSSILQPLQPLKDQVLVLGELMNKNSISSEDGHYTKTANFLTSMPLVRTVDARVDSGGISIDQLIANHIGDKTLFPSLQYGVDRIQSGVDKAVGFTRLYGGTISWKSRTQPCSKEIDPRMAFDRLFRNFVPGKKPLPPDPYKKSVLDLVQDDAHALQKHLGIEDQNKLGEYLEAIRSVEKRLEKQNGVKDFANQITPDIKKELVHLDTRIDEWAEYSEGVDVTEKVRLMMDIMVLAFWSDATRVTSFMFGNSVSNRNFSFLNGVSGNHHSISHHKDDPRQMSQYEIINRWHIEQYSYFLTRLQSIREGNGTLLDNSMILFGSGLRDGNRHSPYNLPILLSGKGGGALNTGQYLEFEKNTPLANVYQTQLKVMGIESGQFGDSTGELDKLLA